MAAPKRELFKAAEVCDMVQVQPYVLRSWEAEFPQLGDVAAGGGPRLYRRSDIELVVRIKHLVFDEGLTLSGARRRLDEEGHQDEGPPLLLGDVLGDPVKERLRHVRSGLQSILLILAKDGVAAAELKLVPPSAGPKKTVAKAAKRK